MPDTVRHCCGNQAPGAVVYFQAEFSRSAGDIATLPHAGQATARNLTRDRAKGTR